MFWITLSVVGIACIVGAVIITVREEQQWRSIRQDLDALSNDEAVVHQWGEILIEPPYDWQRDEAQSQGTARKSTHRTIPLTTEVIEPWQRAHRSVVEGLEMELGASGRKSLEER